MDERRFRIRFAQDYDPHMQGGRSWSSFSPGDVDHRHDYQAVDVPAWDHSPAAENARDFARWKYNQPARYAEINNLTGNAEVWFAKNKHKLDVPLDRGGFTQPSYIGMSFIATGLMIFIPAGIVTWLILGLMYTNLGWDLHFLVFGIGVVTSIIAFFSLILALFGIGMTVLFSPVLLVEALVRGFGFIFASKVDRALARDRRIARKRNREHLKAERAEAKQNRKDAGMGLRSKIGLGRKKRPA